MPQERDEPLVSVLMPIYNGGKYLRKALESIAEQTYSNIEIIAVDSSEDGGVSKEILLSFGERVRYFYKEKSGVASALNYGLSKARGAYVARMDADDISLPERLEKQTAFMEIYSDVGVCGTNIQYMDGEGVLGRHVTFSEHNSRIAADAFLFCPMAHPTVMFRRKLFEQGWRYDERVLAEDYDLWTRMIPEVKFANLPEILLYYRHDMENTSIVLGKRVRESASASRRRMIERLFHIKTEGIYRPEDFLTSATYLPSLEEPWDDYIVRQCAMLQEIYEENRKHDIMDSIEMRRVLNARWLWALGYLGGTAWFRAYSKSGFLSDCLSDAERGRFFLDSLSERYRSASYAEIKGALGEELGGLYREFTSFCVRRFRFAIYGMGELGKELAENYKSLFQAQRLNWELLGVADKKIEAVELADWLTDMPKWNLETIPAEELDYIMISTPLYFDEIKGELMARGVREAAILDGSWMLNRSHGSGCVW